METIGPIQEVVTQYQYFLNAKSSTRNQDFKIKELADNTVFVEFQNRASTTPPVRVRSVEYFGLGIGHSKGNLANQIWFLAEDVKELLRGNTFARYVLKDENTNASPPHSSGILYVSLSQLAQQDDEAGQLAQFFLGREIANPGATVAAIMEVVENSFMDFKQDKEVEKAMTIKEHWEMEAAVRAEAEGRVKGMAEGRVEGMAEGKAQGEAAILEKLATLIENGMAPSEILKQLQQA